MSEKKIEIPSYKNDVKAVESFLHGNVPKKSMDIFVEDAEILGREITSVIKLNVGDSAPDFNLPNATNNVVSLYEVLKNKKVILTFYRGAWCPYCNLQLNQFQEVLPELIQLNTEIIAISPQIADASLSMKEKENLEFEVLSDIGNVVTREFVTVFKNTDVDIIEMKELGIEFDEYYADDSNEIPVPATFVIEQDGTVSYAQSKGGDYRERLEISEVLEALR